MMARKGKAIPGSSNDEHHDDDHTNTPVETRDEPAAGGEKANGSPLKAGSAANGTGETSRESAPRGKNGHSADDAQGKPGEKSFGATPVGKKKALIVAMEDYPGDENDLPGCVHDATVFADILRTKFGFTDFRGLADKEATVEAVTGGLDWLFADVEPNDRIVFYYSGHGYQMADNNGVNQEYLVLYNGFLQDDELVRRSQALPDGVLTVVLDSCFSGGLEKAFTLLADAIAGESPQTGTNLALMAAVRSVKQLQRSTDGRVKVYVPQDNLNLKSLIDQSTRKTEKGLKPFGAARRLGGLSLPTDEEREPGLKGLLISACLEDEKASAKTPMTNGLSAFTFGLDRVLSTRGLPISAATLAREVTTVLKSLGFKQTPQVKEPAGSTLADLAFIELRKIDEERASSASARFAGSTGAQGSLDEMIRERIREALRNSSGAMEEKSMSIGQASVQSDKFFPGFETIVSLAVPAAVNAIGGLFKEYQTAGGQMGGQTSGGQKSFTGMQAGSGDDKFFPGFDQVVSIAVPAAVNAIAGLFKEYQMAGGQMGHQVSGGQKAFTGGQAGANGGDKFFPGFETIVSIAVPAAVNAIGGLFKEYQMAGGQMSGGQMSGGQKAFTGGQTGVDGGDKFFPGFDQVVSIVVPAAVNAITGLLKDYQVAGGQTPGNQKAFTGMQAGANGGDKFFPGFETIVGLAVPAAVNAISGLFKEYQMAGGQMGGQTSGGQKAFTGMQAGSNGGDKFFPGFDQVVSIVVPAAVNAITGLLKDYQAAGGQMPRGGGQEKFSFGIQGPGGFGLGLNF